MIHSLPPWAMNSLWCVFWIRFGEKFIIISTSIHINITSNINIFLSTFSVMSCDFLTFQANIRAKRREEFRAQLSAPTPDPRGETGAWQDPRVPTKPAVRAKRALRFHEPGKFRQLAERLRMKVKTEPKFHPQNLNPQHFILKTSTQPSISYNNPARNSQYYYRRVSFMKCR